MRIAAGAIGGFLLVSLALITLRVAIPQTGSITVDLRDAGSDSWIHGAEIVVGDRYTTAFFTPEHRFSHLPYGSWEVGVSAEGFVPVPRRTVDLSRRNREQTISFRLRGAGIPDLQEVFVFERIEDGLLQTEIRPVDSRGWGIVRHPAMPIAVGAAVWVQMVGGRPAQFPTNEGAFRGPLLMRETLQWSWRDDFDDGYRYQAIAPASRLSPSDGPLAVVDYLVVVADDPAVTQSDVDAYLDRVVEVAMQSAPGMPPAQPLRAGEVDGMRVFMDTSWNVVIR